MKNTLTFPYQAQYCISHSPSGNESHLWLVFHGYGQLAEFFIRKFLPYDSNETLILAPEGTNYGYLKDFQGRVGANWMTKHEREIAIENNHRYLDQLMVEILKNFEVLPTINVLGFSQGAATATRWASRWEGQIRRLILWSGGFAHDLQWNLAKEKFSNTEIISVLGTKDELITQESIEKQRELFQLLEKDGKPFIFEGGHELPAEVLKKIMAQ